MLQNAARELTSSMNSKQGLTMSKKALPDPSCVLKVGDGRGFVIEHRVKSQFRSKRYISRRLIVTAAHCLPEKTPPLRVRI
jgi:hypothetical protein